MLSLCQYRVGSDSGRVFAEGLSGNLVRILDLKVRQENEIVQIVQNYLIFRIAEAAQNCEGVWMGLERCRACLVLKNAHFGVDWVLARGRG